MNTPIRVVELEATPAPGSPSANSATGAFVNVYVQASTDLQARRRAVREVNEAGWKALTTNSVSVVTAESFPTVESGREYYEQCLIDGIVLVFHTWKHEH